jgi:dienelactone hydrolase
MQDLRPVKFRHEGADLVGQIAVPQLPGRHPAVMVMSSAMGLGEHYREIARRLASQGYVALATDMYGNGAHFSQPKEAGASAGLLFRDPVLVRSRVIAWFEVLKSLPEVDADRLAAIGYCFGGQCVLELARSGADLKLVVSFHGLLTTSMPAQTGAVKSLVAVYTGNKDPYAPQKDVDAFLAEMKAAQAHWHLTIFGDAYHAFTTKEDGSLPLEGLGYDPLADAVSWAGTLALLKSVFAS